MMDYFLPNIVIFVLCGIIVITAFYLLARYYNNHNLHWLVCFNPESTIATRLIRLALFIALAYITCSWLYVIVSFFSQLGAVGIVMNLVILFPIMTVAGFYLVVNAEKRGNFRQRFISSSSSTKLWSGTVTCSTAVALSAYGMYEYELNHPDALIRLVYFAVILATCYVFRIMDRNTMRNEERVGNINSPSKVYHDIFIVGVMGYLMLTYCAPFTAQAIISGWGEASRYLLIALAFVLAVRISALYAIKETIGRGITRMSIMYPVLAGGDSEK